MNDAKYIGMDVHQATISAGQPRRATFPLVLDGLKCYIHTPCLEAPDAERLSEQCGRVLRARDGRDNCYSEFAAC
jgi:hypothetical protein